MNHVPNDEPTEPDPGEPAQEQEVFTVTDDILRLGRTGKLKTHYV